MIDPVAIHIGSIKIHWYGIIIAIAFVSATLIAQWRMKKEALNPEHVTNMLLIILPVSIIGARLYYVIFEWHRYHDNILSILAVWEGGLAIHGGLISGALAGIWYAKKHGLPYLKVADIVAPGVILGQAIGRWGNFVNQEAYGGPVSETFMSYFPLFIQQQMYIQGQFVHPTFLYESGWNILVFAFLIVVSTRKKFEGQIAFMYLGLYSIGRMVIEGLRTDSLMLGAVKVAQMMSFSLIIISIVALIVLHKKQKPLIQSQIQSKEYSS